MKVYISTLGDFDIKIGKKSLIKEANRSYRIFKLFQYFITYRNKKLLPENIIDNLWEEHESLDPKNMLRAQIFRLRQTLKNMLPKDGDDELYFDISFLSGYYSLNLGEKVTIDVDEFEALILEGDSNIENNLDETINLYKKALELYKGEYLEENPYEMWLVPIRSYYSRLYFKTLFKLIEIYKEKERYEDIIELCEQAITIEPFKEAIHIYLIEAMLELGQIKDAISHYEHMTPIIEKELGSKSSPAMKDIYRKIENYFIENNEMPLINIKEKLEDTITMPLLCDIDYFKFHYNVKVKKRLNSDEMDYIGSITLKCERCTKVELKEWSTLMTELLEKALRKGDIFTFWNDVQILILLNDSKESGIEAVKRRIEENFKFITDKPRYDINIKFIPLNLEEQELQKSPF